MVVLIIIAAVLIIAAVVALMLTANDISRQKKEIAHLEQLQVNAVATLEETEKQSKTVEGTEQFFQSQRDELRDKRDELAAELDRFEEEVGPEREIGVDDRLGDGSTEEGEGEEAVQDTKQSANKAQPQREIRVRQPTGSKPLDFEESA